MEDTNISTAVDLLFVYYDVGMTDLQSDGILGLSNAQAYKNFLEVAEQEQQIKVWRPKIR